MEKIVKNKRSIILILGIIYTMLTILALISTISTINITSTVGLSFIGVLKVMWWPILIIVVFVLIYLLYYIKKTRIGAMVELLLGLTMLFNNIINMIIYGSNSFVIIFSFIFPLLLISQAVIVLKFKKSSKEEKIESKNIITNKEKVTKTKLKTSNRKENRNKLKSQ